MRKKPSYQLWLGLALVVLIAIFAYFGYRLYHQDKKLNELRVTVVENNTQINSLVGFINQSLAAQANVSQE
ncbi:hypothetical protein EOL72_02900 [Candidatus Falkowbacteria bacterium]|jgi:hypothetical protein|nr:hypothetical protein [Patescibacteria group bacterium]MDD3435293.1 hypothetical protein [Patescibacteria group bacterium]NCU43268.1 hypothetical protein [Candidatus Falkowbacteria bacterium]